MKSRNLNSLGGCTTKPENKIDSAFTQEHVKNTFDTHWARIERVNKRTSYDVKLLDRDEIIRNVGTVGSPLALFPLGKEVLVAMTEGNKYSPIIVGPIFR